MPLPLERKSWIAGIIGTTISLVALIWSVWTYVSPPESPQSLPTNGAMNSGNGAIFVQGNGNTVVAAPSVETNNPSKTPRYFEFSISDQSLELLGKKRHEVHYPKLVGSIASDALARSNHFLKRAALTAYERYADWDEVKIGYKVGFKEFNLLGINYSIFMGNDGAAHPLSTTNAIVLNIETGTEFELKDLFLSGYAKQLNELVRANLKKQENYFPCEEAARNIESATKDAVKGIQGALKDILGHESNICFNTVRDNSQYYLTDTSLVLVFPKYSIAPGASGDVEVPINFKAILSLLNPNGPLRRFL